MDFSWSKEQLDFIKRVEEFARAELSPGYEEREVNGVFPAEQWKKAAQFGILGWHMPKEYGGSGFDALTLVAGLEALGYACPDTGLLFGMAAQMLSVQAPLISFGSDAMKKKYLPDMISGARIGCHAVSEYNAGSDVHHPETIATRDAEGYLVTGKKTWNTNAPVADWFLVLTTVDPSLGAQGLTTFMMDRSTPGLSVRGPFKKMGVCTAMMGEVTLNQCRVSEKDILGKVGSGSSIFTIGMEWERAFILASAVGAMRRQLEQCLAHAKTRVQFGRPIGKNQSVSNKLVEMHMRIETSKLLLYRAAWMKSCGKRLTTQPSEVKLHLAESWVQNSLDAVQIFGTRGYLTEYGIEVQARDSIASRIYSGTSEIQRVILAAHLGL